MPETTAAKTAVAQRSDVCLDIKSLQVASAVLRAANRSARRCGAARGYRALTRRAAISLASNASCISPCFCRCNCWRLVQTRLAFPLRSKELARCIMRRPVSTVARSNDDNSIHFCYSQPHFDLFSDASPRYAINSRLPAPLELHCVALRFRPSQIKAPGIDSFV